MDDIWVLVADEGRARFLALPEYGAELKAVDEITDAGAHASEAALSRDAHGRRGENITTSAGPSELDKETDLFARRVAEHLDHAHRSARYTRLHLVAAPRFLGRLRKALSSQVAACVVGEQDKDLIHLGPRELTQRLFASPGKDATI